MDQSKNVENQTKRIHITIYGKFTWLIFIVLYFTPHAGADKVNSNADKRMVCQELIQKADIQMGNMHFSAAMQNYRIASELCPSSDHFFWLANSYYQLKMCTEASNAIEKIVESQLDMASINHYRYLSNQVNDCLKKIDYKFKAIRVINDINVELNPKILVGQDSCFAPCSLRLLSKETVIEFVNLRTEHKDLPAYPAQITYYEKKNRTVMYTGLPMLVVGGVSLIAGISLFSINDQFVSSDSSFVIKGIYRNTAWTLVGLGVIVTSIGGIALGLGNKKRIGIAIDRL